MFWGKCIQFGEKQKMFWLAYLVEFIKKNYVQWVFFPHFSWAVRLSAAVVLTQVSLITQKYTCDMFKCGAVIISLEAKMLLAQGQD